MKNSNENQVQLHNPSPTTQGIYFLFIFLLRFQLKNDNTKAAPQFQPVKPLVQQAYLQRTFSNREVYNFQLQV